jgi:tRNA pseudouridine65 synthase
MTYMHVTFGLRWISLGLFVVAINGFRMPPLKTLHSVVVPRPLSVRSAEQTTVSKEPYIFNGTVTILEQGEHHMVVSKPPSVVCHHSGWSGSRSSKGTEPEVPMLQRTREAIGERVNLVHRLDRSASGCLLLTKSASDEAGHSATAVLQKAMAETATKTYIALVRGEGILKERDFREEGWFKVDRPIKDEKGIIHDATTYFRFVAGQDNESGTIDRPRASLVLARPKTGRWHQIRRHLNGLSHPILGDTTHGDKKLNREWKEKRGMLPERTCLHLAKLELPPNSVCPNGISQTSPLAPDMMTMLEDYLPDVLRDAESILKEEGINLRGSQESISHVPIQLEI